MAFMTIALLLLVECRRFIVSKGLNNR
jgi:hypothetical protein